MTPKVSIAIPAYKATFLSQAIDSVLAQTFSDWELIIVNDKSPEPISEIIERYTDSRIRYYVNEINMGHEDPTINWNKCLNYAAGEFFTLLCDDDFYEPRFLEELLRLTDKYPDVAVFRSRVKVVDENNRILDYFPSSPEWESPVDYLWHIVSRVRRQTISEFLYRRPMMMKYGGYVSFPKAWCSDFASVLRFSQEGGIASTTMSVCNYRASSLNISADDGRYVRQKVEAQNMFTKYVETFLPDSGEDIRRIILHNRADQERIVQSAYLAVASWKDFRFLWANRKSERYIISARCFLKALSQRMANRLKHLVR